MKRAQVRLSASATVEVILLTVNGGNSNHPAVGGESI